MALGSPSRVAVSAGVTAVADDAFTLTVRVRAVDGAVELAVDVPTTVRVADDAGAAQDLTSGVREAIAAPGKPTRSTSTEGRASAGGARRQRSSTRPTFWNSLRSR